ncbi:proline/glycine betaine ABC transporter permease [Herbivorax sp. ANBcel31]|uniref:ABC transporter permease n=1 Tax=Herbivorax sp. ANBcel31 TaxID=3069754 RepID=UPI0027ADF73A|nr:proline/glycine betaine ABC transporter permease [Herbivorax sp. ANBcel31]MDQ2087573.1 proline/glycine betaine ABC transporter permease [Herbivorax sp. ANBcel31]
MPIPKIPVGDMVESLIEWLTTNFSDLTRAISRFTATIIDGFVDVLMIFPPWVVILISVLLALYITKKYKIALLTLLGMLFIWNLDLWDATIITVSLVVFSTFIAVLAGIPVGILAALNKKVHKIVMPILDFMQTMPAFVYLIPAIPFFGLGVVSATFATVIFAIPPAIRLTALGIRQVPSELIEASDAFGSTGLQKLFKVQLPLSYQTIMAGVNQTIMLSLSMAVIAAMIGAKGLGGEVWKAIQRFRPGMGFEAGLGVVIIAIILDRITQGVRNRKV